VILSAQTIRSLCTGPLFEHARKVSGRRPMIEPFHERTVVNGMSFGLSSCGYDVRIAQTVELKPGAFVLASTVERFDFLHQVVGLVAAKSTLARRGISVHEMTVLEPGWRGHLTLEISMHGHEPFTINAGDPICQILFLRLDEPTMQPYAGKYQDQAAAPIPAILEAAS
jgi:dCTP deaminase